MFPCPHTGTFLALHNLAILFFCVNQRHVAVICFRLLVNQIKDTLRTGQTHNDCVDLIGHLADISAELSGHVKERHCNTDTKSHPGQTQIRHMKIQQGASHQSHYHIEDISDIRQNRHQRVGVLVCTLRHMEQFFINAVEVLFRLLFMTEYFYDFLAVHELFDKTFRLSHLFLLADKISGGTAADFFRHKRHECDSDNHYQKQPDTVIKHDTHYCSYRNQRDQKLRYTLRNQLSQGINIVGIIAHDIAMVMRVKIFNRQILHAVEHLLTQFHQRSLRNHRHSSGISKSRNQRQHIKESQQFHQPEHLSGNRCPISGLPGLLHDRNNILLEYCRQRTDQCVKQNTDNNQRQHHRIKLK